MQWGGWGWFSGCKEEWGRTFVVGAFSDNMLSCVYVVIPWLEEEGRRRGQGSREESPGHHWACCRVKFWGTETGDENFLGCLAGLGMENLQLARLKGKPLYAMTGQRSSLSFGFWYQRQLEQEDEETMAFDVYKCGSLRFLKTWPNFHTYSSTWGWCHIYVTMPPMDGNVAVSRFWWEYGVPLYESFIIY